LPEIDVRRWGPQLRFSAPARLIEDFCRETFSSLAPFVLYGSGDFHHLTALWIRRLSEPVVVVSFDNHPDWDIRPPKWCCGGWVNRALELSHVQQISVWGCGNFECWWPRQIFGNRRAERDGKLEVHPWADHRPERDRGRRGAILANNWQEKFERFADNLGGIAIYVTIDLDCLRPDDAVTNWENGRFSLSDLVWALQTLRRTNRIIAGDICGAYSAPRYARRKQKFISEMDHPRSLPAGLPDASRINNSTLTALWPALAD
jgi:arginase family enzyme